MEKPQAKDTEVHDTETPHSETTQETVSTEVDIEKASAHGSVETKDRNVVTFDKPTDSENPMDWSPAKKTTTIIIVTAMTTLSYASLLCSLVADPC